MHGAERVGRKLHNHRVIYLIDRGLTYRKLSGFVFPISSLDVVVVAKKDSRDSDCTPESLTPTFTHRVFSTIPIEFL